MDTPAPKRKAPVSCSVTLLPLTICTAPTKLLPKLKSMLLAAPAVSVLVPPTESVVPVAWVNPAPLAVRFPVILIAPNCKTVLSTTVRSSNCPLRALKDTVEPKTLPVFPKIML